ncbi:MAG: hypothetical protein V1766_14415 [Pseudomonadota bacterium]
MLRTLDNVSRLPESLFMLNLDTGNILSKLDFFLPMRGRLLVMTSGGPFIIALRSDFCDSIHRRNRHGVVADQMRGGEKR